jgi:hypothetical protein
MKGGTSEIAEVLVVVLFLGFRSRWGSELNQDLNKERGCPLTGALILFITQLNIQVFEKM